MSKHLSLRYATPERRFRHQSSAEAPPLFPHIAASFCYVGFPFFKATEDEDDDGYSQASDDFEPDSEDEGPSQASHRSSHRQQHKARPQQAPPRGARLADSGSGDADTCGSGYYNDAAGMLGEGLEDSVMSTRCGQ